MCKNDTIFRMDKKEYENLLKSSITQKMKQLRLEYGYTQKQVADYVDVERTVYVHYERGDCSLSIYLLKKLACLYGVSTDFFTSLAEPVVPDDLYNGS